MCFEMKNTLKNNRYLTLKQTIQLNALKTSLR